MTALAGPAAEGEEMADAATAPARRSPADAVAGRLRRRRRSAAQLFALMPYAGAPLILGTVLAHVLAGAAPVAFVVGSGTALPEAVAGRASWGLWLAAGAFLLQQALAPVQLVLSREVARRIDAACVTRLTRFALHDATLAGLERPEVADRLNEVDEAFEQWVLTPGAAVEGGLALTARYTQLVGAIGVLAWAMGPWAAVAGALVALVARTGHAEAFHHFGAAFHATQPMRRRVAYIRDLATGTRAAKEIRSLGLLGWLDARFHAETRAYLDPLWARRRRIYGPPFLAYTAVALAGLAVALLVIAHAGGTGSAGHGWRPAEAGMAVQAVVLCGRFGVMFPESDIKLVFGRGAWEALGGFERIVRETTGPATGERRPAPVPADAISFEGVGFGYRPGAPVLDGLDLTLPVGTSTALIGVNGAGKTTLVKLLAGIYTPDTGAVRVDGTDLRELDPDSWQRGFAVTFQDFLRYELSLRDNVAMGAVAHRDDDEGITHELRRVGLGDLLDVLPDGLDTPLTRSLPGGRELSGGQWQRIALARALFAVRHGARVLVLDEPTAQLDARGEAEFYDTFLDLTRGVTSLVISHRFSSVRKADQIVVLDGGRVTEAGTHDELVRRGGQYRRMFEVQARRFGLAGQDPARHTREVSP